MQIQRQISKKKKKALVGQEFDLVLEGASEETELLLEGRTPMHAPEIDGKVFVNDVPEESNRSPASSTAARSPKPTTTIWSPGFCNATVDRNSNRMARKRTVKLRCPICKKVGEEHRPRLPFLQRPLPPDRSRQMGQRRIRDLVSVTDAEEAIRDRNPEDSEDES